MSSSLQLHGLYSPWNSPGQNTEVGSLSLLQGELPNPGNEPRSPALQAHFLPVTYWSGLPYPSLGDLPNPGIEPRSPALQADALPPELPGKPNFSIITFKKKKVLIYIPVSLF